MTKSNKIYALEDTDQDESSTRNSSSTFARRGRNSSISVSHSVRVRRDSTAVGSQRNLDVEMGKKESKRWKNSFFKFVKSIRLYTMLLTVLLILLPVIVLNILWMVGYIILSVGTTDSICAELYRKAFQTFRQSKIECDIYLESAFAPVRQGTVDLPDFNMTKEHLWNVWKTRTNESLLQNSAIRAVFAGLEDGSYISYRFKNQSEDIELMYNWYSINPNHMTIVPVLDLETGEVDESRMISAPHTLEDGKGVPYRLANEGSSDSPKWTVTIADETSGVIFDSAVISKFVDGSLESYMGAARSTYAMSQNIKVISQDISGSHVLILEQKTGHIVSTTFEADGIVRKREDTTESYPVQLINDVGRVLREKYGDDYTGLTDAMGDFNRGESVIMTASSGDQIYILNVGMASANGKGRLVVLIIPQLSQMGLVMIFLFSTVVVSAILILVPAVAALMHGIIIVRPFIQLSILMALAEEMRLEEINRSFSMFTEVAHLQSHFFDLVDRMKIYRAFLPQNLLESVEEKLAVGNTVADVQDVKNASSPGKLRKSSFKEGDDKDNSQAARSITQNDISRTSMSKSSSKAYRFEIGLESRNATVMEVHLENFTKMLSRDTIFSMEEVVDLYADLLEIVRRVVRVHHGNVTNIASTKIDVVWSSSSSTTNISFVPKAIEAATQILEQAQAMNFRNSLHPPATVADVIPMGNDDPPNLKVDLSISIACGEALMGNLGTTGFRQNTIVGPVMKTLKDLSRLNNLYNAVIVVDYVVMQEVYSDWTVRPLLDFGLDRCYASESLGLLHLTPGVRETVKSAVEKIVSQRTVLTAFEVGQRKKIDMDEWMYELEQQENLKQWERYSKAVTEIALNNNVSQGMSLLEEYCKSNPSDNVGRITLDAVQLLSKSQDGQEDVQDDEEEKEGDLNEREATSAENYHHPDFASRTTTYGDSHSEMNGYYSHPDML